MSNPTIKTNNQFRPIIYGYDLTEKERKEYDWMNWDGGSDTNAYSNYFFRYKGWCYYLGDFTTLGLIGDNPFGKKWTGYHSDSFFSGILIRLSDDGESVVVGTYYS